MWLGRSFIANYLLPIALFGLIEFLVIVAAMIDLQRGQDFALVSCFFGLLVFALFRLNEKTMNLFAMMPDSAEKQEYIAKAPMSVDMHYLACVGFTASWVYIATLLIITVIKMWKGYEESEVK